MVTTTTHKSLRQGRDRFRTTDGFLARCKHLLRLRYPQAGSVRRCEALAAGLGCASHAALLAKLHSRPSGLPSAFNWTALEARLGSVVQPVEANADTDFRLDAGEALLGWLFANDGYVSTDGMHISMALLERKETRRREAVLTRLAAQGLLPAPPSDAYGGMPGSLGWSVSWLGLLNGGETVALRLDVDGSKRTRPLGWGQRAPDHGVPVPARGLLHFLGGGWLAGCLRPFEGVPAGFDPDLGRAIGEAGIGLPLLRIGPVPEGILVDDGIHRFLPGTETVLCVEALAALGDALAERIESLGAGAVSEDRDAAAAWRRCRQDDGLRPLAQDSFEWPPVPDLAHEEALAAWMAGRLGMDTELYVRAAIWASLNEHVLLEDRSAITPWDGLVLAGIGMLPDVASEHTLDSAQRGLALRNLVVEAWTAAYYMRWEDRRGATLDEVVATCSPARMAALLDLPAVASLRRA